MVALSLVALLSVASDAQAPSVASLGFTPVKFSPELAESFSETFTLRFRSASGLRVTSKRDVAAVLGVERQQQLLGCSSSSSSCVAELAGALGVSALISGEVAQIGKTIQLTVKVLSARDGRVLFQSIERVEREDAVLDVLDALAEKAAKATRAALEEGVSSGVVSSAPARSKVPLLPAIAGAVMLAAGAGLQISAAGDFAALQPGAANLLDHRNAGSLKQTIGISLLAVGGAALVGGLLWYFLAPEPGSGGLW